MLPVTLATRTKLVVTAELVNATEMWMPLTPTHVMLSQENVPDVYTIQPVRTARCVGNFTTEMHILEIVDVSL